MQARMVESLYWRSYEQRTKDVIATCKELGIAAVAYSPLGRGFLTGQIKSRQDFEGDFRRAYSRFQDENLNHNLKLVESLTTVANRKRVTVAQLCIAWVGALGDHIVPLPGSSNVKRTLENLQAGDVELSSVHRGPDGDCAGFGNISYIGWAVCSLSV